MIRIPIILGLPFWDDHGIFIPSNMQKTVIYPLVICYKKRWKDPPELVREFSHE